MSIKAGVRMEAKRMGNPTAAEIAGTAEKKNAKSFESAGDEYAGEKIKDTADKVGMIGSVGALILGLYVWNNGKESLGFVFGLLIAGAGVLVSCLLVSLLYSYGDMLNETAEQTKILRRLAAKECVEEVPVTGAVRAQTNEAETGEVEPAGAADEALAEPDTIREEQIAAEADGAEPARGNPDVPLVAFEFDRVRRIARFKSRSKAGVICPVCYKWQKPDGDICYRCSCSFVFADERHD
jgi:hypothetical protein